MQSKLSSEELAQELRDRYSYNPLTGQLIHRKRLKPISTQKARYQTTSIYVDGQLYRMNVHMAVWLWFYGAKPQHTVDHIDRDKRNNRIWNLRDVDMFDQNRNNRNTKLTVADVKVIKQRLRNGELQRVIAADYNVGKGAINDINCGRNWANVA